MENAHSVVNVGRGIIGLWRRFVYSHHLGGLATVAAVKAVTTSGVYLVDDFTVYLGPLQQARTVSFIFYSR